MEFLRVPDLGPPVPITGQITGLDVDLRYLVCLFVLLSSIGARCLEKCGFVLV